VPKYSEFVFEIVDSTFHDRAQDIQKKGEHNIIVGGESYGQGSSREHAALCPMYLGVKAVLAKSLERIHTANLINFGIVPLLFENPADYESISQGDDVEISGIAAALKTGGKIKVVDKTSGKTIPVKYALSDRHREIILAGGTLNYMGKK
jgi:aconitate hydratase